MNTDTRTVTLRWFVVMITVLCLLGMVGCAMATEPSGAILVPITPKPWLVAPTTVPTPTPAGIATPAPTDNLTEPLPMDAEGSSLDGWEQTEALLAPSPTVEALPSTAQGISLPGILGLSNPTVFRLLLIGTDAYTLKDAGRSDTMVLVQVDTSTCEVKLVSFLRDLYVQIPGHGKTRLNAAYVYGGESLLRQTLYERFDVSADRSLAVNFSVMVDVIDRIGGVLVDVSEKERKQLNSILKFYNTKNGYAQKDELLQEAGVQRLTGKQALCYSRIRKMDSDFMRTGRQRKVLEGVYQQVKTLEPLTLAGILADAMGEVKTDMTLADAAALVPVLLKLDQVSFHELTVPVKNSYNNETVAGMSVLVANMDKNRDAIAAFLEPGDVLP